MNFKLHTGCTEAKCFPLRDDGPVVNADDDDDYVLKVGVMAN